MKRERPSVLIIDDDEFLCKGLEFALRKLGIDSVPTSNPEEFLLQDATRDFDLYLIDLYLADGRSGMELVERLRANHGAAARIIMVSAAGDIPIIEEALERGANDYILKPLDREHLAAKLSRYVRTPEMAEFGSVVGNTVTEGRVPGKLSFQTTLIEIDERGVRFLGPHSLPKGTALWLSGDLIREIAGSASVKGSCVVKVSSSWVDSDGGFQYGAYAEFDQALGDLQWFRALRRWLALRSEET